MPQHVWLNPKHLIYLHFSAIFQRNFSEGTTMIRIALAQINTTVGDLAGNAEKIVKTIRHAEDSGADICMFPELALTGYPPEDLIMKRRFVDDNNKYLNQIASDNRNIVTIVGFVGNDTNGVSNSAALLQGGRIVTSYAKICLPNYSVFDEKRYFIPGNQPLVFEYRGVKFGLNICEDIWVSEGVPECQGFTGGAEVILSISASPYYVDKRNERLALGAGHARKTRSILAYVNLTGGQDELVFDGNSFIVDHRGELLVEGKQFEEDFLLFDVDTTGLNAFRSGDAEFQKDRSEFSSPYSVNFVSLSGPGSLSEKKQLTVTTYAPLSHTEEIYRALVLGTRDYVRKNGFERVVIGLSGGIDSALTAAIAVDALGAANVIGVLMPSKYTSETSNDDAQMLSNNLRIKTTIIPIKSSYDAYIETLKPVFSNLPEDITEENLQARIRGNLLMALSNKFGWLVLTTGNKSETSVGYSTLYGDMAGGFAVIKDVPKTVVYRLAALVNQNAGREIIPASTMTKAPTAELRPDQKDQDSLPPYDLLDRILEEYVENDKAIAEIEELGFDEEVVRKVARMVDINEYKRRQAPPGIKITRKAFGKDRRMPITNRYR
jgi:NAD+ synthase (glutamine-hydrolysing)